MNARDISTAKDPLLRGSYPALLRAAQMARQTAIETNTDLIIMRDGQLVRIPAADLRTQTPPDNAPTA